MYSPHIFDEMQAVMYERELLARQVQLESEARRAAADVDADPTLTVGRPSSKLARLASFVTPRAWARGSRA